MNPSPKRTYDIIWIDDQFAHLFPLIRPLVDQGFTYLGLETYYDALANMDVIQTAKLLLLDMIIPSGPVAELPGDERFLGLAVLKHLRRLDLRTPVIVYTVVRDEAVLEQLTTHEPLVVKIFQKGGKFQTADFWELARRILQSGAAQ